jgi:hypothetical protein
VGTSDDLVAHTEQNGEDKRSLDVVVYPSWNCAGGSICELVVHT